MHGKPLLFILISEGEARAEPLESKKMKLTPSQAKEIQFQTNKFNDGYFPVDFELTRLCDGAVLLTVTEYRSLSTEWAGFIVGKRGAFKIAYKSDNFVY